MDVDRDWLEARYNETRWLIHVLEGLTPDDTKGMMFAPTYMTTMSLIWMIDGNLAAILITNDEARRKQVLGALSPIGDGR